MSATVNQIISELNMDILNLSDGGKIVTSGYTCDLLSWVIGRAEPGSAFITIMTNINVAAVGLLADVSCIILCESVEFDGNALQKAKDEEINILRTAKSAFETSYEVMKLING